MREIEITSQIPTPVNQSVRFVLTEPSHPGNIGAVARAIKVMGFHQLYLCAPKRFPDPEATAMAVGAVDILEQAIVVSSLAEAVADCHLVLGSSNRQRRLQWQCLTPQAACAKINQVASGKKTAIVFGRESSGLSNQELELCHYLIKIPCNPDFRSLNLAAAVQVITYELRRSLTSDKAITVPTDELDTLASSAELERFYQHLETRLLDSEFLSKRQPVSLMRRLRKLFNRTHLTQREVNILRGVINALRLGKE